MLHVLNRCARWRIRKVPFKAV
uniref:Uncharacterized protein n=1 Tax=Anguilla anguilla TaxID=7936 RepID=A0A0E9VCS0_ANGAN